MAADYPGTVRIQTSHYFDHAATTPLSEAARTALTDHMDVIGNAGSLHGAGRNARRVHDTARMELARAVGVDPAEVILTSGGTEADNLAIKGIFSQRNLPGEGTKAIRPRIVHTGIEHHAVLDVIDHLVATHGAEAVVVPVEQSGRVDLKAWRAAVLGDPERTALATLMWANNEVGTIQPVEEAAAIAGQVGIPFHTDAVQAFGHITTHLEDPNITTAAITAHKLGGPVGIGALVVRRTANLTAQIHGGGQERGMRSGTADVAAASAFAAAATASVQGLAVESLRLSRLRARFIDGLRQAVPEVQISGSEDPDQQLPGIVHMSMPGAQGDSVLFLLDSAGFATSTGSACTAGLAQPSHVLLALGRTRSEATNVQRFSLGPLSTEDGVDDLLRVLPDALRRAVLAG